MQKTATLLPIEELRFITTALRMHDITSDVIIERAEDLRVNGMDNTPTAYKLANGITYIGDGATRLRSAQKLQEDGMTIEGVDDGMFPVMLVDKSDDPSFTEEDILLAQIRGNATVEKTANKNYIDAIYNIMVTKDMTVDQLAASIGKSVKHTRNMMKTLSLPEELRELISPKGGEDKISFNNAVDLQKVYKKVENSAELDGVPAVDEVVSKSKELSNVEFKVYLEEVEDQIKEARRGLTSAPVEFAPKEKFIGKDELREMLDEARIEGDAPAIFVLEQAFSIDEVSVAKQKAAWDEKLAAKAEKAAQKKKQSKGVDDMSDDEIQAILDARKA